MGQLVDLTRQDFGYALGQLRQSPGFTSAAVLCLALGVWLACVVSAVGRGVYRPELGFAHPNRVVQIDEGDVFGLDYSGRRIVSRSVIDGLRGAHIFAAIGDYQGTSFQLAGDAKRRFATRLSSGMFPVFGIRPVLGRAFLPAEDSSDAGNVAILSYDFWRRQFGGDTAVIGQDLHISERAPHTIVGVMPPAFNFPHEHPIDIYIASGSTISRGATFNTVRSMLARLRDGSTIEQAEGVARDLAARGVAADREELIASWAAHGQHYMLRSPTPVSVHAARYRHEPTGVQADALMALIIASGLCVVLIACANVANLLLVRGAGRRQEIAVRMALGASRVRIVMHLIAESVILSVTGAAVGFMLAFWHWRLLDSSFMLRGVFGQMDRYAALTAAILGVVLVAVFGLLPALRASSVRLEQVLRDSRRSEMGATRLDGVLSRLVIGSTAGTVMLLASAVLLGLSARDTLSRQRFQSKNVVVTDVGFERRVTTRQIIAQAQRTLDVLSQRPGVLATAIAPLPAHFLGGGGLIRVTPTGRDVIDLPDPIVRSVTGGYFSTLRIPIVAGRTFTPAESADSIGLVIVGVALAQKLWPGQSAVGQVARFAYPGDKVGTLTTVVGVVADVTMKANGTPSNEIYFPFGLTPSRFTTALVRTKSDGQEAQIGAAIKMSGADMKMLVGEAMTLEQRQRESDLGRYVYIGFALFAGAGLILVTIGLYGVIAFSVARRTHEIGVRLAMGADRRDVVWMIGSQGLRMTLIGAVIGLALSFGLAQVLRGMLPGVNPADPRIVLGIIGVVIAVSLVASCLPGRRAAKLDPMSALRSE